MKDKSVMEYIIETMQQIAHLYIQEGKYDAAKTALDIIAEMEKELEKAAILDAANDAAKNPVN